MIIILFLSLPTLAAVFVEPGVGLVYDDSRFRQDNATQSIEHDGRALGGELFGRAGLGLGSLRFGLTGSYSVSSLRHRTRYDRVVTHYGSYSNTFHQRLIGPHLGLVSVGTGVRLFGEYYTYAQRTSRYNDGDNMNHFYKYDELHGRGWGLGLGIYRLFGASSIMYRNLVFNEFDFKGSNRTDVLNQDFKPQQIHEIIFQLSFPLDAVGRLMGKSAEGGAVSAGKTGEGFWRGIGDLLLKKK